MQAYQYLLIYYYNKGESEKAKNYIEKINTISKENVASIDNVSQASDHLHAMTENLNNELSKFRS